MKRFLLVAGFLVLTHWSQGQTVGFRAIAETADNSIADKAFGLGAYVSFNNSSDKFEVMIHGDYVRKKDKLSESGGTIYNYQRRAVGVAGLYRFALADKISFKLGPDFSYNWIEASRRGVMLPFITDYDANYTGLGVMTNLHFEQVFKLPINLELFATPNYLIRSKAEKYRNAFKSIKQLNLQVGVSYPIVKN